MTLSQLTYRAVPYALAIVWGFVVSVWYVFGILN